jgi:hypothetical protein
MATAESRYLLRIAETRIWHSGFHFLSNNGKVIENHSADLVTSKTCVARRVLLLLLLYVCIKYDRVHCRES